VNALELADDLESHLFAIGKERPFYEHATMLRQQQAEIEALKAECKRLSEWLLKVGEKDDAHP